MSPVVETGLMREGEVERVRRSTWAWESTGFISPRALYHQLRSRSQKGFAPRETEEVHEGRDVRP